MKRRSVLSFLLTVIMVISVMLPVQTVYARLMVDEDTPADQGISGESQLTPMDLGYWFQGIDEKTYSRRLRESANTTPTTGVGYCAAWVSYVYQGAGLGFVGGNACDMWQFLCSSRDSDEIREGMIIAVRYSSASELGRIYGHCGVLLKNQDYQGKDLRSQIAPLEKRIEEIETRLNSKNDKETPAEDLPDLRSELHSLRSELRQLEAEDDDIYYSVKGCLVQADPNGNEKWLVADSTTGVGVSPLSVWIRNFDLSSTAAWGWGHNFSGRVMVWTGDLPADVPFVYHEENETALKDLYGIDIDHISDDELYGAIAYVCGAPEGQAGAIRLDGGAFVDSTKYYELTGHMTEKQFLRWTDILTNKRNKEQQEAAEKEAAEKAAKEAAEKEAAEKAAKEQAEKEAAEKAAKEAAEKEAAEKAAAEKAQAEKAQAEKAAAEKAAAEQAAAEQAAAEKAAADAKAQAEAEAARAAAEQAAAETQTNAPEPTIPETVPQETTTLAPETTAQEPPSDPQPQEPVNPETGTDAPVEPVVPEPEPPEVPPTPEPDPTVGTEEPVPEPVVTNPEP